MNQISIGKDLWFYEEEEEYSGVRKIADKVRKDIKLVTDIFPPCMRRAELTGHKEDINAVIYGTVGKSPCWSS